MGNEKRDIEAVNKFLRSNEYKMHIDTSLLKLGDYIKCIGCRPDVEIGHRVYIDKTFRVDERCDGYGEDFCLFDIKNGKEVHKSWDYAYFELVTEPKIDWSIKQVFCIYHTELGTQHKRFSGGDAETEAHEWAQRKAVEDGVEVAILGAQKQIIKAQAVSVPMVFSD